MLPGTVLTAISVLSQVLGPQAVKMSPRMNLWLAPWDLAYNMWAEWFWGGPTRLSAVTLIPCVVLAVLAVRRWRERVPFFSPFTFALLAALYALVPYVFTYWAYANTRIAPLLWMAMLVRVPARLPHRLAQTLAIAGVLYSVSLGIDFVRMEKDRQEFIAGIPYVPEHAKLLPMVFRSKGVSENSRPLSHTWGYYVLEKETAAPLLFASSRLYGVTYRTPPPPQLEHVPLEGFIGRMRQPDWICDSLRDGGARVGDCEATWREYWRAFWEVAEPRFDWLLLWDAAPETMTILPPSYHEVFHEGRLTIMTRTPKSATLP
jgi:hypothetical protein